MRITVSETELRSLGHELGLPEVSTAKYGRLFLFCLYVTFHLRIESAHAIVDEVRYLEGVGRPTGTKPPEAFAREPLRGFRHKHYMQSAFLAQNLINQLNSKRPVATPLGAIIERIRGESESPHITEEMINRVAHEMTVGAYEERASQSQLTGEWIVYAERDAVRYYLTVATHDYGDENLMATLRNAYVNEFPFLFQNR